MRGKFLKALIVIGFGGFAGHVIAWTVTNKVVDLRNEGEPSILKSSIGSDEFSEEFALNKVESVHESKVADKIITASKIKKIESVDNAKNINHEMLEGEFLTKKNPGFHKKTAKPTVSERVQDNYWAAVEHISNSGAKEAEDLLLSNLNMLPKHHASRSELVTLYLKNERLEEAEFLLKEGLRLDSNESSFLKLMAVLEDRKGAPEKALSQLIKVKDFNAKDKNYIALLGHLYHETGNYSLARQQYFRLMEAEPNNPVWLLGVALSWDSEGERKPALEGYRRLAKGGNLDPEILKYVRERIKALKG